MATPHCNIASRSLHLVVGPADGQPRFLNIATPRKTGSEALFFYMNKVYVTPNMTRAHHLIQCVGTLDAADANASMYSYVVVRNPYERMLSAFLGQIAAPQPEAPRDRWAGGSLRLSFAPGPGCARNFSRYTAFKPTPANLLIL